MAASIIDSPTTFGLGPLVDGVVFTTAGFATEGSPLAAFNAKYKAKLAEIRKYLGTDDWEALSLI